MIQYFTIFLLFLRILAITSGRKSQNCTFLYNRDYPDKASVLLWNYMLLMEPKKNAIVLKAGDEITVACPGRRNTLVKTGTKFTTAKCVSNKTLNIGETYYQLSDLSCSTFVTGECQPTTTPCGAHRGVIKHIGHNINHTFLTLFDICYDDKKGEALYADHVIYGSAISYKKMRKTRPAFKVGGLVSDVKADNYKQASQIQTLTELLGSADLAEHYIHYRSYLAKGHLAPDADQVYVTSAFSTYFFMNTVPQWQQINNGNWKSLENFVRKVAENTGEDLKVITGGWEVLQLEDINGNLVDIHLSGDKLPVPKFIWKIVYSSDSRKGIAFVCLNNPFLREVPENEYICKDICDTYGWGTSGWNNVSKGLLYCCEISELREIMDIIPDIVVTDILEGSTASNILRRLFGRFGFDEINGNVHYKQV